MAEIRSNIDLTAMLHELSVQVVTKAKENGLHFTFAESCTGGLLAKSITDIAGSSAVFYGSIVSYSDEVKASVLRVSSKTLDEVGAVSADCASQMASGVLGVIPSDIAISVTGFAGPDGGTEENPLGTVYFGIATKNGIIKTFKKTFEGTRENVRLQTAVTAFETLLAFIEFLKKD